MRLSRNSFSLQHFTTLCYILDMEQEEFYTVKEFAKLLKISTETVRRAIRAGKIAAIKFTDSENGSWRISRHQLDRMTTNYQIKYGEK
jgi:excisionase family DNA binding protein